MLVTNMLTRGGNKASNQFIITRSNREVFQSYMTTIAVKYNDGLVILDAKWLDDPLRSRTTSYYRNQFLGEDFKTTLKKVKDGTYKTGNLNDRIA